MEFVYLNDKLVDAETASISVHDLGLLYGVGLFETLSCYRGRPFRLEDHLDRLFGSAQALSMQITVERGHIEYAIAELLRANHLDDAARLRLTVTPGSLRGADPEAPPANTLLITATALAGYPAELYDQGIVAALAGPRQHGDDLACRHKTLNYLGRLLALQEAQRKKCGEALWFTPANRLAQGCIRNLFLVCQDRLLTPPLETPVVPGVTRKLVLELAGQADLEAREMDLTLEDVKRASELFLTNSSMGLMPVRQFETMAIGGRQPGPVYTRLARLYRGLIEQA